MKYVTRKLSDRGRNLLFKAKVGLVKPGFHRIYFALFLLLLCFKGHTQAIPTAGVVTLSPSEEEVFRKQTLKKINNFQSHLAFIASRAYTKAEKHIYKETTLENFINKGKDVSMEVSSNQGGQVRRFRKLLINYLDNLCNLSYAKIELKAAKSCYVSNLIRSGFDSNGYPLYKATATYYQEFIGYNSDGMPVYRDIVQKTVEVQVRFSTDVDKPRWIVYLGDISIAEILD